jgi:hypothetical protein
MRGVLWEEHQMEQIIVQVKDKHKAQILLELLTDLDFVTAVKTNTAEDEDMQTMTPVQALDFFELAGLWENRDINLQSIRQQAWPRRSV